MNGQLVAASILLSLLSGCAASDSPIVVDGACGSEIEAYCQVSESTISITGANLARGLQVHLSGNQRLLLSDVRIQDAVVADLTGCSECTVVLQNAEISTGGIALEVKGTTGHVLLKDSRLLAPVGLQLPDESHLSIAIDHVTFASSQRDSAFAIGGPSLSTLDSMTISHVAIGGFAIGIAAQPSQFLVDGLTLDCKIAGITTWRGVLQKNPGEQFSASHLTMRGCADKSLDLRAYPTIQLNNIFIDGGTKAIDEMAPSFAIANFTLANAGYGIFMKGDNTGMLSGSYKDGVVSNCAYGGIQAKYESVVVDRVRFTNNGHAWPDPDEFIPPGGSPDPHKYGGLYPRYPNNTPPLSANPTLEVHNSSFEGNVPYAVSGSGYPTGDARNNWWGSSDGPHIYFAGGPYQGLPIPLPSLDAGGHGDNVTESLLFLPFLSAPP